MDPPIQAAKAACLHQLIDGLRGGTYPDAESNRKPDVWRRAMKLNHMLVPAKDKIASANFFAEMMGLETGPVGHFAPVRIDESLVLDFADINDVNLWEAENGHFARQHYAFEVSDAEFDAIFGRIKAKEM